MPNPWFRLYSEFADDPKVQILPEHMQRRLVMLFCERCKCETLHETQRAFHWRITPMELAETKALFIQSGFIDENWYLTNWNRRQFLSDSSTERVRRFRQEKKQDETLHETEMKQPVTAPEAEAEQIHKQHSPKPRKRSSEMKHSTDPRHIACKEAIFAYYQKHNEGDDPDWEGREGRALGMFLKSNPKLTAEGIRKLLAHRSRSELNHSDRPALWISNLKSFRMGPLNQYGKPLNDGGTNVGTDQSKPSPAKQRLDANRRALAEAAIKRGWYTPNGNSGEGAAALAEPGHGGVDGGVSSGLRAVGPEILPPEIV